MTLPTETYTFTIPAGGMYPLLTVGRMFKIISATGAVNVTGDRFGTFGPILAGQGLRDVDFSQLQFVDVSGAANRVTVIVGDSVFIDDRITGEVSVVDGGKARTLAGGIGLVSGQLPAVAGQVCKSGIWNPAGSGRRAVMRSMRAALSLAGDIYIARINAALPSLTVPFSLLADGSAFGGSCRAAGDTSAGYAGTIVGTLSVPASQTVEFRLDEPIVIRPGYGIVFQSAAVNVQLTTFLTFFEELDA